MGNNNQLIIPIYINEKVVLDMLAIIDDGFYTVSQVNYSEIRDESKSAGINLGVGTSALLSKLLKIDITGDASSSKNETKNESVAREKVHTNVSLLSKLRQYLQNNNLLKTDFNIEYMEIGDFIEVEGELQKNPLINCLDIFDDLFRISNVFAEKPELGNKTQTKNQKKQEKGLFDQLKEFTKELKHSGTIDFILNDKNGTVILSTQEQYLSNDNISEIIGGRFKILGKVIKICKDENESIDLLRKTSLSILPDTIIKSIYETFNDSELRDYNLPTLVTKIDGPAIIVIPIAIYA